MDTPTPTEFAEQCAALPWDDLVNGPFGPWSAAVEAIRDARARGTALGPEYREAFQDAQKRALAGLDPEPPSQAAQELRSVQEALRAAQRQAQRAARETLSAALKAWAGARSLTPTQRAAYWALTGQGLPGGQITDEESAAYAAIQAAGLEGIARG